MGPLFAGQLSYSQALVRAEGSTSVDPSNHVQLKCDSKSHEKNLTRTRLVLSRRGKDDVVTSRVERIIERTDVKLGPAVIVRLEDPNALHSQSGQQRGDKELGTHFWR